MTSGTARLIMLACALFCSTAIFAQELKTEKAENAFSVSAQIRPRAEYRNGAYRPLQQGEAPAILINNRTRLTMDYANSDKLTLRISAQNINVWGQDAQVQAITPASGNFSVFEAYGDIKLGENFRSKIGRQTIALDDERIFGGLDWHPAGRSHDALNFSWKDGSVAELQAYFAYNQNYKAFGKNVNNPAGQYFTPIDAQPYQHMEMLHGKFFVGEKSYVSVLLNNLGFKNDVAELPNIIPGKQYNMQTIGANWFGNYGQWKNHLSAYYQTGKNAAGRKKSAYMLSGSIGYQLSQPVGITAGADYLSGDDPANVSADKTNYFDPLYGTHHKFYGAMDYFYVAGPNTPGLLDMYLNFAVKAAAKTNISLAAHMFRTAADVNISNQKMSRDLGTELDLTFTHQVHPMVGLSGGYSTYFHTSTLRFIKSTFDARKYQDWAWLSININPKIFFARF